MASRKGEETVMSPAVIDLTLQSASSASRSTTSGDEDCKTFTADSEEIGFDSSDELLPYETAVHNGWPCFKFSDTLQPTKALDLLLNLAPESDKVCSSKPVGVTEQSTFVIASKHLENEADIKADDLGVWIHKGKPVRMYKVARSQSGSVLGASLTKDRGENVYKLIRVYYHHKHTGTFRRTLFFAYDTFGKRIPLTIVQYTFSDGVEIPVKMAPHGNSKRNKRPHYRTQPSTLQSIKENLPMGSPKEVLSTTYKRAGGVLQMKSSGEVGRNLRQVYNMKSSQGSTSGLASNCEKDLVYDLLEQHYTSEREFVRSVSFEGGVMSVVGTDKQFDDIERFCACDDPVRGSVLGIDPTFNLGDFYVTPTVYEHKMIQNKVTGKHPTFLGPTLIHQDRKSSTYHYFASQIRVMRPGVEGLCAVGTDGEEALSSAFLSVFPRSTHLLCSLHKRDNIRRKLRELCVGEAGIKQILADVFGTSNDNTEILGLVDSSDQHDFADKLERLRPQWELVSPEFFQWFVTHEMEVMCSSMIASVRTLCGLGKPPNRFTTNNNESLNNLIKRRVNFKRSEWPQFNKILRSITEEQQAEFEKSIFGEGEYELVDEFKYLEVPHLRWIQMNPDQRKAKIKQAYNAKIVSLDRRSNEYQPAPKKQVMDVNITDARIGHVSRERLQDMWEKAEELLSTDGLVLPAAGATTSARQVASLAAFKAAKSESPHYVTTQRRKDGTEVRCDCPVFRSTPNICQHSLAAAQDLGCLSNYLQWVRRTKGSPNLSLLIGDAVPRSGGQKSTQRRKGAPKHKKSTTDSVVLSSCMDTSILPSFSPAFSTSSPLPSFPPSFPINSNAPCASTFSTPSLPLSCSTPTASPVSSSYMLPPTPSSGHSLCTTFSPVLQLNSPLYAQSIDMHSQYNFASSSCTSDSSNGLQQNLFTLQWLTGSRIRMCYGCASPIRTDTSTIPPPPYDLVIRFKERRSYHDPITQQPKLTKNEENTYYHPLRRCVLIKHPSFQPWMLVISHELLQTLSPTHKLHLSHNFGLYF